MDRCKISEWEVAQGAPDRVNIPCLMHDTCLCHIDNQNDKLARKQDNVNKNPFEMF